MVFRFMAKKEQINPLCFKLLMIAGRVIAEVYMALTAFITELIMMWLKLWRFWAVNRLIIGYKLGNSLIVTNVLR